MKEYINNDLGVKLTINGNNVTLESLSPRRESMLADGRIEVWVNETIAAHEQTINQSESI